MYVLLERKINQITLVSLLIKIRGKGCLFHNFNEAEYEIVRNYTNEAGCCSGLWNSLSPFSGKLSTIDVLLVLCSIGWLPPLFHGV